MELFSKISELFGKKKISIFVSNEEIIEAGACPNCWGRNEYDRHYKEYVYDQKKSNINHDRQGKKAFIQQFVEDHITGIRLKKNGNQLSCPTCKNKYKYVSSNAN